MYKTINGWTKEKMKAQIRAKNNGERATQFCVVWESPRCVYETPDGNHCAVGCFIPDGHEGMKHQGASFDLIYRFPDLVSHMPLERDGLRIMQIAHDNSEDSRDRRELLCEWIDNNVEDSVA